MSRCIPFPPSDYAWNGVKGEALIELLKIRRDIAETARQRKKDEKTRIKKEKEAKSGRKRKLNKLFKQTQCLKQSSLVQELKHCIFSGTLHNPLTKTQISNRTIKHNWLTNGFCNHGSFFRVDYKLQKDKESGVVSTYPAFSTKNETDSKRQFSLTSKSGVSYTESERRDFIVSLVPCRVQGERFAFDDQEWLFHRSKMRAISPYNGNEDSSHESSFIYPCARHLREIDTYALPYTIPF